MGAARPAAQGPRARGGVARSPRRRPCGGGIGCFTAALPPLRRLRGNAFGGAAGTACSLHPACGGGLGWGQPRGTMPAREPHASCRPRSRRRAGAALDCRRPGDTPAEPRTRHAARLGRHRRRARLHRPAVRDRELRRPDAALRPRAAAGARFIYPLSLAIYCTSWTFFGSVGLASRTGFDFLTIYLGPILMIGLCSPLIMRIVRLAKAQNITSIADFIAARYGKAQAVAATVALIAIIGTIPYIALQLKAVSSSLDHHPGAYRAGERRDAAGARRHRAASSRSRWRSSRCCSAPATSTPPSTRTG